MMRKIVVAGAGALGSFLAARMVDCGQQVDILARGQRLGELQASGAKICLGGQIRSLPVSASDSCTGIGRADLILLACKHGDLVRLLPLLRECSGPDTVFLTVQNGVEAPQLVAAEFPDAVVIASRVHGFFELQDGLVRHVGVTPSVTFGVAHGPADSAKADCAQEQLAQEELARLLSAAQIDHAASPDIMAELWEKFLLAASLGGVGAAYALSAGGILRDTNASKLLRAAMEEVFALAQRKSIALPADCVASTREFVANFPFEATTSMQRDLLAGRPSEYDCLPGAVLRFAEECDVPVPAFRSIDAMIRTRGLLP